MTEESPKKAHLIDILTKVADAQAPDVEAMAQEIARGARRVRDAAGLEREIILRLPDDRSLPAETWDREQARWQEWSAAADKLQSPRYDVTSFVALSTNTTAAVSLSAGDIAQMPTLSPTDKQALTLFVVRFHESLDRPQIIEEVRALMRRLSLDVRSPAYRSTLQLLDESLGALERPVAGDGGPASVLLALRECIDAAVREMIRRRPCQEPAGRFDEKILSLGRQCGLIGLSPGAFDRLADEGKRLLDRLSNGKQHAVSRDGLFELFDGGLLYLKGLLESIDAVRLRAP